MAQTFDPELVSVIVDAEPIVGFTNGTPITASRLVDSVALKVGMKGAAGWALMSDKSGVITLILLASHPDNDILAALENARAEFPVMIKDNSGRSLAFGESARIQKHADRVYGVEIPDTTWTILVAKLEMFTAGN